jgi:serine/threonine-protein kinase
VVEVPRDVPATRPPPANPQTPPPQQQTATVVAPPAAQKVAVKISSSPEGAGIFKDGRQIGTAPTELLLSRDEVHSLTFRLADHQDAERQLDFSNLAGLEQTVDVTLEPVRKAQPTSRPRPPKQGGSSNIPVFE